MEYKFNSSGFFARNFTRVAGEAVFFGFVSLFFYSKNSDWIPLNVKFFVLTLLVAYIFLDVILYKTKKNMCEKLTIIMTDDCLRFYESDKWVDIPYSDLILMGVSKKNGDVVEIRIKSKFGQKIKLKYLTNLSDLLSELIKKGVAISDGYTPDKSSVS